MANSALNPELLARAIAKASEPDLDWDNESEFDLLDRETLIDSAERIIAVLAETTTPPKETSMSEPHITTLPASLRDEAARQTEACIEFNEGDFYREVDTVSALVAHYYIEQGAKAAAKQMGLHFCDENGHSFVTDVTEADIDQFARSSVDHVLMLSRKPRRGDTNE
jgi:hypothetical protein